MKSVVNKVVETVEQQCGVATVFRQNDDIGINLLREPGD
jgi:hypothetical protein